MLLPVTHILYFSANMHLEQTYHVISAAVRYLCIMHSVYDTMTG